MLRLLVVYGTTDGHTAKVARFLADEFRAKGGLVDVCDSDTENPDPRDYVGVVVAASLHGGRYQHGVARWVRSHAAALRGKPTAFLSVCLAVLETDPAVEHELEAIQQHFFAQTGWTPPWVKRVAGALLYTQYGWFKRMVMRRLVAKAGGSTDLSRDHVYTDWEALRVFVNAFFATCRLLQNQQPAA